jgi:hypothetical protein
LLIAQLQADAIDGKFQDEDVHVLEMCMDAIRHGDVRVLSNSLEVIAGLQVMAWLGFKTEPQRRDVTVSTSLNAQRLGWMS